jgi:hypothetical protein
MKIGILVRKEKAIPMNRNRLKCFHNGNELEKELLFNVLISYFAIKKAPPKQGQEIFGL